MNRTDKTLYLLLFFMLYILAYPNCCKAQSSDHPGINPVLNEALTHPELKDYTLSSFLLILEPGFNNEVAHRHGGDLFGYVIEGSIELVMENSDPIIFKAGEIFQEKHRQLHNAYRNPSQTDTTKVLIFQVNKDGEQGFIPINDH